MRKLFLMLTLFAAFMAVPWNASSQETLTVAEGTATNSYVPVYGFYMDAYLRAQIIYPATMLADMTDGEISKLTYYLSSPAEAAWGNTMAVKMMEVSDAVFSGDFINTDNADVVFTGILDGTGNTMDVILDESYNYGGGNLLVEFYSINVGTYKSSSFAGISSPGSSVQGYDYSSLSGVTASDRDFIPKTTFEYEPTDPNLCRRVKGLVVSDITTDGATISWIDTNNTNTSATYDIAVVSVVDEELDTQIVANNVSGYTYTLTGRNPNTAYAVLVRAVCAADNITNWAAVTFRTSCDAAMALPYSTGFSNDFDATYTPLCWYKLRSDIYMNGNDTLYTPLVWGNAGPNGTGDNALGFNQTGYTDTAMICTSIIPASLNGAWVRFNMRVNSGSAVKVGFISDTSDISTFVEAYTINSNDHGTAYREYDLYTNDYPTMVDHRLAFMATGSCVAAIDNVKIVEHNGCARPTEASITNVGHYTADVVVSGAGIANWQARYNTTFDNGDTSFTILDADFSNDTVGTLTNLYPDSTYYVWVRTVCGVEHSEWRYAGSFTTNRTCYPVTNFTIENTSFNSTHVSWSYGNNGRGLDETGVHFILMDSVVIREWDMPIEQGTSCFISNLQPATNYTLKIRATCDPDTSSYISRSFGTTSCGEVSGTSTTSYTPFNANWKYGYTQSLYPASSVTGIDQVTGLSWYITSAASSYPGRLVDVWIAYTNRTELSVTDHIDTTDMVKVASNDTIWVNQQGWTTIQFSEPWPVNNAGANIVVAVVNKTGQYSSCTWRAHAGVGVYGYDDNNSSNYYNISAFSYKDVVSSVADIRFVGECNIDCYPANLALAGVETFSVDLMWLRGGNENEWVIQYKLDSVDNWTTTPATADTVYSVTGLEPASLYAFRVGVPCGDDTVWSNVIATYTGCAPFNAPWEENFDEWGSSFNTCWSRYSGGWSTTPSLTPTTSGWLIKTMSDENKQLYHNTYGENAKYWAVSPMITVDQALAFSFDVKLTKYNGYTTAPTFNSNQREFIVGISTDGGETWAPLASWGNGANYTYAYNTLGLETTNYFFILPDTLIGQNVRFAFYAGSWASGDDNDIYIDNIMVASASCVRPTNLHATTVASDNATLEWSDFSTENTAGYEVVFSTTNNVNDTNAVTLTTEAGVTTVSFEELQPQTDYYWWVRSLCSDSAIWVGSSFRTGCPEVVYPLEDDFQSYPSGSGSFPECWTLVSGYSSYPYVYNYGSGYGKVLYIYAYSTQRNILATPYLPSPLNNLEVSFDYYTSSGICGVYAATDPYDQGTWTLLKNMTGSSWRHYEFATDTIIPNMVDTGYIVFATNPSTGYISGYLDNVSIARGNTCQRPAYVDTVSVTPYTATLVWPAVSGAVGYRVKYNTVDDITTADSIADVTDTTAILEGLQNGAEYFVWLQTVCTEDGLSYARTINFQTKISCYPIANLHMTGRNLTTAAYMWDYEDRGIEPTGVIVTLHNMSDTTVEDIEEPAMGENYHIFNDLNPESNYRITFRTVCDPDTSAALSIVLTAEPCAAVTGTDDNSYIPLYGYYNYGTTQALYPASAASGMEQVNGLSWYVDNPISDARIIDVYIGGTNDTLLSTTTPVPLTSMTKVVSNATLDVSHTGWVSVNFSSPWTIPDSIENIVVNVVNKTGSYTSGLTWRSHPGSGIYAYSDSPSGTNYALFSAYSTVSAATTVADIEFVGNCTRDLTACQPAVVAVSDVDVNTAELSWFGNAASYTVQYRPIGDTTWVDAATDATSPLVVNGLESGTYYETRVIAMCENDTIISNIVEFSTECALENIPFDFVSEDFQVAYITGFSPCWKNHGFTLSSNGYTYTSSSSSWLALPAIADPLNTAQVKLSVAATSSNQTNMQVGIMETTGDITWVDTISLIHSSSSSDVHDYVVYLDSYTGAGDRVVLAGTSSNSIYIHEIHVMPLDNCRTVNSVAVSNITDTSATVTWTAREGQTQWLVFLNGVLQGTATSATYQLTGLSGSTNYTVSVRTFCGAGDTAMGVDAAFITPCSTVTLPWDENFNAWSSFSECWSRYSGAYSNTPSISTTTSGWNLQSSYGSIAISGKALCMNIYSTNQYWAVSPNIAMNADSATLSFAVAGEPWSSSSSAFDADDRFVVAVSSNNGNTWTPVYQMGADATRDDATLTSLTSTFTNVSVPINGYNGQNILIAFFGGSTASGGDNRIAVDSIRLVAQAVTPQPQDTCNAPVIATASSELGNITITWSGDASSYEVAAVKGAWNNPAAQSVVTGNSYTFENLEIGSSYTVGVRAVCGNARSTWATRSVMVVGIDGAESVLLGIYPNPATVSVTLELAETSNVTIVDAAGRKVSSQTMNEGKNVVDLDGYAAGAYYVRVTGASGTAVRKLVIR